MLKYLLDNWKTVPNFISIVRILLIPVFGVLYYNDNLVPALIILAVSGFTDLIDGKIARRFNQVSNLGKLLDPLADKLTQITIAIILLLKFRASDDTLIRAFGWVFLVFLVKEAIMVVGAVVMLALKLTPGAAEIYGKLATVIFYVVMIAIVGFGPDVGALREYFTMPDALTIIMISLAAISTLIAFASYMPETFRQFKSLRNKDKAEK